MTTLVAQTVKSLPAMKETWVQSLGWEDSLGKGMATHSMGSTGSQTVRHNRVTNTFMKMPEGEEEQPGRENSMCKAWTIRN